MLIFSSLVAAISAQTCPWSSSCLLQYNGGSGPCATIECSGSGGSGLYVQAISGSSSKVGIDVYTTTNGSATRSYSAFVNGVEGRSASFQASGVYGDNYSGGFGVAGRTNAQGVAVYGDNICNGGSCIGWAGYFTGRVYVSGWLAKAGGGFLIDHPQDPQNRYLSHSFVESPDMKNLYDGVATLDSSGRATVTMPSYFQAANKEFRYQLTPIGNPASLFVAREISNGSFEIAGGSPGLRVSWLVTSTRNDAFARMYRMLPEQSKATEDVGSYLHPECFGQPESSRQRATRAPITTFQQTTRPVP